MKTATDPIQTQPALLTKKDVAELLRCTERSVERYVATRQLPAPIKLSARGGLRWRRATIEAWLAQREAEAQR